MVVYYIFFLKFEKRMVLLKMDSSNSIYLLIDGQMHSTQSLVLEKNCAHHFELVMCESHVFGLRACSSLPFLRIVGGSDRIHFFLFRVLHIVLPSIFLHGWIGKCARYKCPDVSSSRILIWFVCDKIMYTSTFFQASSGIQFNWNCPPMTIPLK